MFASVNITVLGLTNLDVNLKSMDHVEIFKHIAPLAAEGAMCIFYTFEKNAFKDLQPLEKSS